MIVIPLVFASVVRGLTASENMEQLRSMGLRALGFFVATTVIATGGGIGLALLLAFAWLFVLDETELGSAEEQPDEG